MWGTTYIQEIQKQFVTVYGFAEAPGRPGIPAFVPDGEYPMTINGRLDRVQVKDGRIHCCNFDTEAK